jgi:4-diphosphocytidyl-2-C-methyl-D-erythritol kinase
LLALETTGLKKIYKLYCNYPIKSNAKINLGLKVLNKRIDGFHNLQSIFIEIDLHDKLIFSESKNFKFSCNIKKIENDKNNTVTKTYNTLNTSFTFKKQYHIQLIKNIPCGSGMGGGSSNAACVINTLNQLENLNLTKNKLLKFSEMIGSDVPFFINGKIQFVQGKGEILKAHAAPIKKQLYILLIIPKFSISTKWAFSKIKKTLHESSRGYKFPALDSNVNWKFFKNDFEEIVGSTYPEIFEIKDTLYKNGALYSGLSGSGSTVFGIYNNHELASCANSQFVKYKTILAKPI